MTEQFQDILKEYKWMFFIFILWAVTYIALSEGVLTKEKTITVTGSSVNATQNEIATFNVNVSTNNADKASAVEETNTRSNNVLDAIKSFGIPEEDIKTASMSIYQQQDYINGKYVDGDWYASVGIEIKLKNIDNVNELTDLIFSLDVDNFYGPNFSVDTFSLDQTALLDAAVEDAHSKAMTVAESMGKKLGSMVSFIEGSSSTSNYYPLKDRAGGLGEGSPLMPGTSDISKTVVVTYKVK